MTQEIYNYLLIREKFLKKSLEDLINETRKNNDFENTVKFIYEIMNHENIFLLKKKYYEVMVDFYEKANEAGCLGEGEEITCSGYNDVDNLTQMVDILSDANEIRNGEMADLALGCFEIADYLYGDVNLTSGGDEE